MKKTIKKSIEESIAIKQKVFEDLSDSIEAAVNVIVDSLKKGGKLILFGNGGSAADAQHIACELVGRFRKERKPIAAVALSTNTSNLTCIANDYDYSEVFSRQIEAIGKKDDIALGISTSGSAANVIAAINKAKGMDIKTIALTGKDGGELAKQADLSLIVPSNSTPRIQESHITIGHVICQLVEESLS